MAARVFITQPISPQALERLRTIAHVDLNSDPLRILSKNELKAAVRDCDVLFCLLHDRVDREVIAAGSKLRAIASMTITPADIDTYIASGEWRGKAGGCALQGKASAFIPWINGSPSNVEGLPLERVAQLLRGTP